MSEEPPSSHASPEGGQEGKGPFGRHVSARPEGSPYPKAELLPRLLARLTDFIIAAILPLTAGQPGGVLAVLYLTFADGLFRGQSPGKKLLGIKVVHLPSRRDADFRESALRNFPFGLALLLEMIPKIGDFLFLTFGLTLLFYEGWQVVSDKLGLRMGDLFASTQVVDTKVLAGAVAAPGRPLLKAVGSDGSHARGAAKIVLLEPRAGGRQAP